MKKELINESDRQVLLTKVQEAEAIVVGAASGMSASAGYTFWYENDKIFHKYFDDFYRKYHFTGTFNGFYHHYRTAEERWAFIARMVHMQYELPTGDVYYDLMELLRDKNYFILTTNQDFQFTRVVPEEKLAAIQGDWRYFQCSRRCHDEIYYNEDQIHKMNEAIQDTHIPSDMIPRCSKCGAPMEPWVRGYTFLEGKKYKQEYEKLNAFLEENLNKKILFLELGVGRMTPMFIQEPFWNLTYRLPQAFYISINPKDALLPKELKTKGLAIHEDISKILKDTLNMMK